MGQLMRGLAAALALALPSAGWTETVIKYSSWLPLQHHMHTNAVAPFMADVERVTEGRVRVELLPKLVGTMPMQYDAVRDGLVDMAVFVPGATPGRFPLIEVAELPLLEDEAMVAAPAVWRLYDTQLRQYGEFDDVHILSIFSTAAGHFCMNSRAIHEPADLQGMKLRTALASTIPLVEGLGAVPVQKPTGEIYELLSGGTLDGTLLGPEAVVGFNLTDVVDHITLIPGGLYVSVLALAINKQVWDSISEGDQAAISDVAGEYFAARIGKTYSDAAVSAVEVLTAQGTEIIVADGPLVDAITQAAAPSEGAWIKKASDAGVSGAAEVLADFKADLVEHKATWAAAN